MPLDAGLMFCEITLKTVTKTQDTETGEEIVDWDLLDENVWAQWLPAGTREAWLAQQRLNTFIDGVFRIYDRSPRPDPALTRISYDGRIFDVKPWVEIGRGEGLELPVTGRET